MNLELAKELQEAGFRQNYPWACGCNGPISCLDHSVIRPNYYPTLSELIEACGVCLSHIKRYPVEDKVYWLAVSHCGHVQHEPDGNNIEKQESTPAEAVARLWLALNPTN